MNIENIIFWMKIVLVTISVLSFIFGFAGMRFCYSGGKWGKYYVIGVATGIVAFILCYCSI